MEMDGEAVPPSRKAGKKAAKQLATPSKRKLVPPSFADKAVKQAHHDRFSGLWECYYDKMEEMVPTDSATGEVRLKNIRGFLLKRRKSPLKGWHKRYFVLERGLLYFSRTQAQMGKGKVVSSLDLGLAFIHCEGNTRRIDIDGEHQVLHLKTKAASHFAVWSSCLLSHEMFRKAQLVGEQNDSTHVSKGGVVSEGETLELWSQRTHDVVHNFKKDLEAVHENLDSLAVLVRPANHSTTATSVQLSVPESKSETSSLSDATSVTGAGVVGGGAVEGGGGKLKKKTEKKKKKTEKKTKESNLVNANANTSPELTPLSSSTPQLEDTVVFLDNQTLKDEYGAIAKIVFAQFCEMLDSIERLESGIKQAVEHEHSIRIQQQNVISNQQLLLRQALTQNDELRDRLSQIQALSSGAENPQVAMAAQPASTRRTPSQSAYRASSIPRFGSYMSLQSSLSEKFFDALDDLNELSSESEEEVEAEGSDEESAEEYESETEMFSLTDEVFDSLNITPRQLKVPLPPPPPQPRDKKQTFPPSGEEEEEEEEGEEGGRKPVVLRRTQLPSAMVDVGDFSLWSLLRKNIGKDLSKISMPVTLNEPLSALQRLCEELQYSQLLDEASQLEGIYDRMVKVAAFAVSAYAQTYYRTSGKPFNPLLGETFECVREDREFKFIAEQVSHHPPIAACHCESPNYHFWQDARIKNKFWGKSMEVFPIGTVNVTLPKYGDHYQWKKITSCIYNLFGGGQRWVDQYGEMVITNLDRCTCKLTFVKASYWSSKKYIVHGDVYSPEGQMVRHLFGTWHEAMFCGEPDSAECIWRADPMPLHHAQYYGLSQFAIELNGMEEGLEGKLPRTDCRFRPDQRLMEEGRVQEAEGEKHRVEQIQRVARAERERLGQEWSPNFFQRKQDGQADECWVSKGNYWTHRDSGFSALKLPDLFQ